MAAVKPEEAIAALEKASAYELLMELYVQKGDFDSVAKLYERARQFDQAALAWERAGKHGLARKAYERARDNAGANRMRDLEVKKLIERGDRLGAATLLVPAGRRADAVELLKPLPPPKAYRFMQRLKLDEEAQTLATSELARAESENKPVAKARWLELTGKLQEAADLFEQHGRKDRAFPIYEQLKNWPKAAELAFDAGNKRKALELFEKAGDAAGLERAKAMPDQAPKKARGPRRRGRGPRREGRDRSRPRARARPPRRRPRPSRRPSSLLETRRSSGAVGSAHRERCRRPCDFPAPGNHARQAGEPALELPRTLGTAVTWTCSRIASGGTRAVDSGPQASRSEPLDPRLALLMDQQTQKRTAAGDDRPFAEVEAQLEKAGRVEDLIRLYEARAQKVGFAEAAAVALPRRRPLARPAAQPPARRGALPARAASATRRASTRSAGCAPRSSSATTSPASPRCSSGSPRSPAGPRPRCCSSAPPICTSRSSGAAIARASAASSRPAPTRRTGCPTGGCGSCSSPTTATRARSTRSSASARRSARPTSPRSTCSSPSGSSTTRPSTAWR